MSETFYRPGPGSFTRSPLSRWFGGKYYMAKKLVALIPAHICYCEPFAGAAWVYFKKRPSPYEVLNDINLDLINFWETVRVNPEYLVERLDMALPSRFLFETYRDMEPEEIEALAPEERAWRIFYILKNSFSGRNVCEATAWHKRLMRDAGKKSKRATFQIKKFDAKTRYVSRWFPKELYKSDIIKCHERMKDTCVEALPWERCVGLYDRGTTFFYLDPPYPNHLEAYGAEIFGMDDLERMAELLPGMAGKFMLTLNDCPTARELFAGFNQFFISTIYCGGQGTVKKDAAELLITNYTPDERAMKKAGLVRIQP